MAQADTSKVVAFKRKKLDEETLISLYKGMLLPRLIEEKMLKQLRQGKISKWFSGIGQEAISTGVTLALTPEEMIFPMHRNLAVFTNRGIPMHRLFSQWQGKCQGFTKGRDRSFHFGTIDYNVVGMISHLGPQLALACGVALSYKLKGEPKVAVAFTGEGGTSEGDFHEALNVASVWDLPVIFVIENNGYGLSTPVSEQYNCKRLADRGKGYGMNALSIDGNNVIEVYKTISKYAEEMRTNPAPLLLECNTFRRRGHEEASGTKYVPDELMQYWEARDPVERFEEYLLSEKIISLASVEGYRKQFKNEIEEHLALAQEDKVTEATVVTEIADVFAPVSIEHHVDGPESTEMRLVDAIANGLDEAMSRHDNLVLMGQDITEYGGVFKITEGLLDKYGPDRVRNTPLCESAIVGTAIGLSFGGFKSMMEMQFADFVTCGFNQIVNNAAKLHYRWGQNVDVVIRMPTGGGVGAGPFHSQSNEGWFFQVPGLKIVYPSTPEDAKGLLLSAFEDPNPVLYFEHKALYRNLTGDVPEGYYTTPIGKARIALSGDQAAVITYGMGVHWATRVAEELDISLEVIDLRSLAPIDYESISEAVKKTHRALVLHEATLTGGVGAEIAAYITEHLFEYLDAPVIRVASLDTPVPFASHLEEQFLPLARLKEQIQKLIEY